MQRDRAALKPWDPRAGEAPVPCPALVVLLSEIRIRCMLSLPIGYLISCMDGVLRRLLTAWSPYVHQPMKAIRSLRVAAEMLITRQFVIWDRRRSRHGVSLFFT